MRMAVESSTIIIFIPSPLLHSLTSGAESAKLYRSHNCRPTAGILESVAFASRRLAAALRKTAIRAREGDDARCDLRQRMQGLRRADFPGSARHSPHHARRLILCHRGGTGLAHFFHAGCTVAPHSGEHDADRVTAGRLRPRAKQYINRGAVPIDRNCIAQPAQTLIAGANHQDVLIARSDVYVTR